MPSAWGTSMAAFEKNEAKQQELKDSLGGKEPYLKVTQVLKRAE